MHPKNQIKFTISICLSISSFAIYAEGYINENMVVFTSSMDPDESPWKTILNVFQSYKMASPLKHGMCNIPIWITPHSPQNTSPHKNLRPNQLNANIKFIFQTTCKELEYSKVFIPMENHVALLNIQTISITAKSTSGLPMA